MKAFLTLFLVIFQIFTQDVGYLEIVKKIKEEGLPEPDYNLSFDDKEWMPEKLDAFVKESLKKARKKEWTSEERAFIHSIESAPKKLEFEGNEAEFHPEILANPRAALNIVSSKDFPASHETILQTCQECGRFTRQFRQTLHVLHQYLPKSVKRCSGHQIIEEAYVKGISDQKKRKKIADKKVVEIKQNLDKDPSIQKTYSVEKTKDIHKTHIDIIVRFNHIDDSFACNHSHEVKIEGAIGEKDEWRTDETGERRESRGLSRPHREGRRSLRQCRQLPAREREPHCSESNSRECRDWQGA